LACVSVATAVWRKLSHQTAPLGLTALPTDTVTVTDPTHPLYNLSLPLISITTKPRLGRVCVVWLYPGVERIVPVAATSLGKLPIQPASCRLSVTSVHALLTVVTSCSVLHQEVTNEASKTQSYSKSLCPPTPAPLGGSRTATPAPTFIPDGVSRGDLGEPFTAASDAGPADDSAHLTGGVP
jgi:hypothetical protein